MNKQLAIIVVAVLLGVVFALPASTPIAPRPIPHETPSDTPHDGSVLFWQDSLLVKPILKRTNSHLTHAAVILNDYVYEACPPRVHKVPILAYMRMTSQFIVWMSRNTKSCRSAIILSQENSWGTTKGI